LTYDTVISVGVLGVGLRVVSGESRGSHPDVDGFFAGIMYVLFGNSYVDYV